MDEIGFSHFFDHMLMSNMRNMVGMVFDTKVYTFYEKYYVKNCGQSHMAIVAKNMEQKKMHIRASTQSRGEE